MVLEAVACDEYPRRDSNPRSWLRRPVLYPLSYGGDAETIAGDRSMDKAGPSSRPLNDEDVRKPGLQSVEVEATVAGSASKSVYKGLDILARG